MDPALEERLAELGRRCGLKDASPKAVLAFVVLCAIAIVWCAWRWWPASGVDGGEPEPALSGIESSAPAESSGEPGESSSESTTADVLVHVVGAVRHPGVYSVTDGARVGDAVALAGGMLPDAVPELINLARVVTDGEQVVVPSEDDVKSATAAGGGAGAGSGAAGGASVGAGAGAGAGAAAGGLVDINTADAALLDTLPGVGPSTAAKIIADREANGPFASLEDLGRVSGIGPKRIEQLKSVACVR